MNIKTYFSLKFWKNELNSELFLLKKLPPVTYKIVILSLIFGSLIRFLGLFNFGFRFDMLETQFHWGDMTVSSGGFWNFWRDYPYYRHYDYPPVSLVYEWLLAIISSPFSNEAAVFVFLLKATNWFVDILLILTFIFFARIFSNFNSSKIYLLASLLYLNPAIWFVTGVWGQNDTLISLVPIFCLVLIYFAENYQTGFKPYYKDLYFWSGVLWAFGFLIKQQPILLLPILFLVFFENKTWKELFRLTFWLGCLLFLLIIIKDSYLKFGTEFLPNFNYFQLTILLGGLFMFLPFAITYIKRNKQSSPWFKFIRWALGASMIFFVVNFPFFIINPWRLGRVTFAAVIRDPEVSSGAYNLWRTVQIANEYPVIKVNIFSYQLDLYTGQISVFIALTIIAFFLLGVWNKKIKHVFLSFIGLYPLKKLTNYNFSFKQAISLFFIVNSSYFYFFTRMHSRYLHTGLILSFLMLTFSKTSVEFKNWLWAILFLNIAYTFNQLGVLSSNNSRPAFAGEIFNWLTFNKDIFFGIVILFALIKFYTMLMNNFFDLKNKE